MARFYTSLSEIESIVDQFSNHTLPADQWTHQAHLTVALWHLFNYTTEEATCYLRSRIISYNQSQGKRNSPTEGYHETMTLFWIKVIDNYLKETTYNLLESCNSFLETEFSKGNYVFSFYSKDLILSTKARAFWTEPDLKLLHT
ncbi:MAG: hypothetical protein H7Y07_04935 [Pyrinomonadaceae bacterium]|nr:hypothetical protein [Sphingobacteriaceae bacterium]